MRNTLSLSVVALALVTLACGGRQYVTVTIPPRVDLSQYGGVALATFTVEHARGSLHDLATRRFAEAMLHSTGSVEVLEIGDLGPVLQASGEQEFGPISARAVGVEHDVPAVFTGHLTVSSVKPSGGFGAFGIPHVEATVAVELNVALHSTRTGATLWRSGASAGERVGHVSISGGQPSFSAKDPDAAYGRLVDRLVSSVSRDFYPTYERR